MSVKSNRIQHNILSITKYANFGLVARKFKTKMSPISTQVQRIPQKSKVNAALFTFESVHYFNFNHISQWRTVTKYVIKLDLSMQQQQQFVSDWHKRDGMTDKMVTGETILHLIAESDIDFISDMKIKNLQFHFYSFLSSRCN